MKLLEIELPSNRKFGFFFTLLFAISAFYLYCFVDMSWAFVLASISFILLIITLVKSQALLPLNKMWMRLGLFLGKITSPIILGLIFFGLFTPIAIMMRLGGRDELRLKFTSKTSHWILRNNPIKHESFKNQF